jgi:Family of unknown function (DUF6390)
MIDVIDRPMAAGEIGRITPRPAQPGTLGLTQPGALLFARFAFPPNALGLCGPDTGTALVEHVRDAHVDAELRRIARGFEGAWPYLELIAGENDIRDPLDARVVEAYWLGNELLGRVGPRAHHADLDGRFRDRARPKEWRWLETKADSEAVVHHSFHVLEVLPRIGLIRGGVPTDVVGVLGRCLIRPGRVVGRGPTGLDVLAAPLEMVDGALRFGAPRAEHLPYAEVDAYGDDPGVGDLVALHWDRMCGRLDPGQARRLDAVTHRNLAVANATL